MVISFPKFQQQRLITELGKFCNSSIWEIRRVSSIVNLMKSYRKNISDEIVMAKMLRSLTKKFEHAVAAIEESKDLSKYSFDVLMDYYIAHVDKINKCHKKIKEKAFQVKEESSFSKEKSSIFFGRDRGRGGFRGQVKAAVEAEVNSMTLVILRVNFSDSIARSSIIQKHIVGLSKRTVKIKQISVRTRCSNHMTSIRFLFRDLDESQKCDIRLDDDKQVRVEGKGAIAIKTM
ncbi:hypothetical protein KY290_027600 [Solanum tuberosum]|uniref:Retrovirus-related Pol polyprotein from transposon TNT 1-94-like beta-barrel domain-containing protein n=1 Tax=Solanum tuberosum TaxID=4113 RepID=A0ABQ7UFJ9_SOLTU|nr:hypothetical protein KY290_027600 [Solanum tuberosum]